MCHDGSDWRLDASGGGGGGDFVLDSHVSSVGCMPAGGPWTHGCTNSVKTFSMNQDHVHLNMHVRARQLALQALRVKWSV